jgi:hypothetical protein
MKRKKSRKDEFSSKRPSDKETRNRKRTKKLFEGRNIIKKVKTHCLKIYFTLVKSLMIHKGVFETVMMSAHKNKILRLFKSDISKTRNKSLLDLSMSKIIKLLMNVDLMELIYYVRTEKILKFKFLLNCSWRDFLFYIGHRSKELWGPKEAKSKESQIFKLNLKDINEYLRYVENSTKIYKDRVRVDEEYLDIFKIIKRDGEIVNNSNLDLNSQISLSREFINWVNFVFLTKN